RAVPPASGPSGRRHAVAVAALDASGRELARVPADVGADPVVPEGLPTGDDVVWVPDAGDEDWARVRPSGGWDALRRIARVADPATRIVLWNALRDGVLDAELDPLEAVAVLTSQLPGESLDIVVQTVLGFATGPLAGAFVPADRRAGVVADLRALAGTVLEQGEPGSDRQLVGWRQLVDLADDPALLRRWWSGEDLPAGRELDEELTWRIAVRLSELGEPDVIAPTRERHPTSTGRARAARARAGVPDLADKEWAWEVLTRPSELSAYEVYAVADGFFRPGQEELTEPFVAAWFEAVPGTAAFRSGWSLSTVVTRSFPLAHVTAATAEAADRLLARTDLDAGLRRAVTDQTDLLRRALRSRERFGG
uniref:ERAP1-like C-terminal domain-containing protein n=1 Tax=Desertihabitans aurantiacus TaxID=2282477 RepID=UPI001E641499